MGTNVRVALDDYHISRRTRNPLQTLDNKNASLENEIIPKIGIRTKDTLVLQLIFICSILLCQFN